MNARKTKRSHLKIPLCVNKRLIFFSGNGEIPREKGKDAFGRRRDMLFF